MAEDEVEQPQDTGSSVTPEAEVEQPQDTESSETPEAEAPLTEAPGAVPDAETAEEPPEASPESPEEGPALSGVVEVGAVVEGPVQRITPYGAFISLPGGRFGLVHISEIDRNYVKDVHDHLREGDTVRAKVLTIKEDGKIDLSIKALQDPQPPVDRRRHSDPDFEQMLRKFMRQSEERQVDLKRSVMHKRK